MAASKRGTGLMAIEMSENNGKAKGSNIVLNGEIQVDMINDTLPSSILSRFTTSSVEWKNPKNPDEDAVVHLGGDYDGYRIKVGYKNGKKNGEGLVIRGDGTPWMRVHYVNDVVEGEVLEYDEYNNVVMRVMMKNGKEVGLLRRYDKNGNEVSMSMFRDGNRVELKKNRATGFYEERDGLGELVSVIVLTKDLMSNEGVYYEYKYGHVARACEYKNGEFTRVLKSISGSTMTEFDENGNKVYEGEYDERIENGLKRKGKGKEYEKDGKTLVYVGDWSNGKRNGYGVLYKNSEVVYKGEWENGIPFGEGSFVKADGSVVEGKWEYGYLSVGGNRWVDYEDGMVIRSRDKRRLRNWVLRGGEEPPGCGQVVKGWMESVWDVVSWVLGGLWSGVCWCASELWEHSVVTLSLILSIQFGKYLSRFGWWGWTCPIWYVVLVIIVRVCTENGWIWDEDNEKELRYFQCNALLHAVSMASFHWLPRTFRSWAGSNSFDYVVFLPSLVVPFHILLYIYACDGLSHNMRYNTFHLFPIVGLVAVSYEESKSSCFCLIYGIGIFINVIVCAVLCFNKKPILPLAILWDSILLLIMALTTRSYSVIEIIVSTLLIIVSTVAQFVLLKV